MYWLGYGAYYFLDLPGQHLVESVKCQDVVYFDTKVFTQEMNKLNNYIDFKYKGQIGVLICNYEKGTLFLNESVFVDLRELIKHNKLQELAMFLFDECMSNDNVYDFASKLYVKRFEYKIKSINLSEVLMSFLGLLNK